MSKLALSPRAKRKEALRTIDFTGHKPRKAAALIQFAPPKPKPVDLTELFGAFKSYARSTGEDMLIVRAFLHKQGLKEIPEHFTVSQFASAMQWSLRPRHVWVHFMWFEEVAARKFLSAWASALLPQLTAA